MEFQTQQFNAHPAITCFAHLASMSTSDNINLALRLKKGNIISLRDRLPHNTSEKILVRQKSSVPWEAVVWKRLVTMTSLATGPFVLSKKSSVSTAAETASYIKERQSIELTHYTSARRSRWSVEYVRRRLTELKSQRTSASQASYRRSKQTA